MLPLRQIDFKAMRIPRCEAGWWHRSRTGFSIIEAVMVLLVVATVVGALTPSVIRQITHARINRAANVIAADFFLAQSLAGRQHQPVNVVFSPGAKTTTISDAGSGTALYTRRFGPESEFKLTTFTATPASVQVLPNGMTNASVIVSIGDASYQKQIRMPRAGQIRIID